MPIPRMKMAHLAWKYHGNLPYSSMIRTYDNGNKLLHERHGRLVDEMK